MREFFVDSQGRMWYASSVNNKVGYFYLSDAAETKIAIAVGPARPRPFADEPSRVRS